MLAGMLALALGGMAMANDLNNRRFIVPRFAPAGPAARKADPGVTVRCVLLVMLLLAVLVLGRLYYR
jgi:hypothetical protein